MTQKSTRYICLYQYGLLGVLILTGISMGFWQEVIIPTLPNLSAKLNVSYETMGYMMSMRSAGNVFALILVAILYDSYPFLVHYFMFFECLLGGITTIIIPWCMNYWIVVLFFFIQSGCQNSLNNGAQLTILRIFQEKSIGKMQLFHLGYGIGGVLSGLVSQQFLPKKMSNGIKLTKYCIKTRALTQVTKNDTISNIVAVPSVDHTRFEYIYLIAGLFAVTSACIFLSYKFIRNPIIDNTKKTKKESWLRKINPKYVADGNVCYWSVMTTLLFMYYFLYILAIVIFIPFVVVYAIDPCKSYSMSQHSATYLHTALNVCFLIGRVIGSFLLDFRPTLSLLMFNVMNIFFNLILVFLSHKYALALWIGACGMRLCNSIVYPSGTSYVNRYIVVTSSLISLAFLGDTFGAFAGSAIGGYLIDNYPSQYITYGCCTAMCSFMTIVSCIVILGHKHGLREFPNESKNGNQSKQVELT